MENITAVTSFILAAYTELKDYRYLYSTCLFFVYIVILLLNSILFFVICNERGLHEPMYLFICNISVNGVFGSSVLLLSMLVHLLSQNYEISVSHCLLQGYCVFVYAIIEYPILAVMAYDRYVAVYHPLHYHLLMSPSKTYRVIALCWFIPCVYFSFIFIPTARLSFCVKHIDKVYCSNVHLRKLSCFETSAEDIVLRLLMIVCPGIPILLILYSYAQILRICIFSSKESQIKALQTCSPHLLAMMNYTVGVLFEVLHSSSNMGHVAFKARIFMSIYFLIIPPLTNPIIYGMSIQAIRVQIFRLFIGKEKANKLFSR